MIEHLFIDFANSLLYDGHGNVLRYESRGVVGFGGSTVR